MNCIARIAQNLALTTLEVTTISFIVVFLVTSFCWRHKPLDVSTAIVLETQTHIDIIRAEVNYLTQLFWKENNHGILSPRIVRTHRKNGFELR